MSKKPEEKPLETMDDVWKDFEATVLRPAASYGELSDDVLAFLRECFFAGAVGFRGLYYDCMKEGSLQGVIKLNSGLDAALEKIIAHRHAKTAVMVDGEKKERVH